MDHYLPTPDKPTKRKFPASKLIHVYKKINVKFSRPKQPWEILGLSSSSVCMICWIFVPMLCIEQTLFYPVWIEEKDYHHAPRIQFRIPHNILEKIALWNDGLNPNLEIESESEQVILKRLDKTTNHRIDREDPQIPSKRPMNSKREKKCDS